MSHSPPAHGTICGVKTRLIFSVAVVGATTVIGTASAAVAQEGTGQPPASDPPAALAPSQGATGATGESDASAASGGAGEQPASDQRSAPGKPAPKAKPATIKLYPHQLKHGKVRVAKRLEVTGKMIPFVPNQRVQVAFIRKGRVLREVQPKAKQVGNKPVGEFNFRTPALIKPGTYKIRVHHARSKQQKAASKQINGIDIRYPDLDPGDRGPLVKMLNKLLAKQGYYPSHGSSYSARTGRALLAFRKVHNMARTSQANPSIFKTLAGGEGGFKLKHPGAGKHVEVDLSRQVMVLANKGKAQAIFPISSGAAATPTIKGHFKFYRKEPGYNNLRMYYSVYFIRGYATHGFDPDPIYPASHGCLRNPIPDAKFIYNWIDLGDSIYVYN